MTINKETLNAKFPAVAGAISEAVTGDPTELARRVISDQINAEPGSREALETEHGNVWDTTQLQEDFVVVGFSAPFVLVTRKEDGKRGTLVFQNRPRFYFSFVEDKE